MTFRSHLAASFLLVAANLLAPPLVAADAGQATPRPADQPAPTPDATLEAMKSAPPRGLLYTVSKGPRRAYLFGTIHVGKADFFPLDWTTTQALAQSSALAVELDAMQADRISAALQRYAVLPKPKTLATELPPDLLRRLNAQLDAFRMPRDSVQGLKPWMATLSLSLGAYQHYGYSFEYASDLYLTALAKGLAKPVVELEGAEEQFGIFDRLSRPDQLTFLSESLTYLENGQMPADLQSIIGAWLGNDAAALQNAVAKSYRDHPRSSRWIKPKLFTDRNVRMVDKIDRMLAQGESPFVAVGALHLVGTDGLPALLRKRGYHVESVYPDARPIKTIDRAR
ncbi:MAG: TraB/GumN family protein [Thiobacillus sp.]|nr:TraB/GumN family protein [Thiobacillus sp.]